MNRTALQLTAITLSFNGGHLAIVLEGPPTIEGVLQAWGPYMRAEHQRTMRQRLLQCVGQAGLTSLYAKAQENEPNPPRCGYSIEMLPGLMITLSLCELWRTTEAS